MRITRLAVTPVSVPVRAPRLHSEGVTPHLSRTILEMWTDDGLVGLGEVGTRVSAPDIERAKSILLGLDPYDVEQLRDALCRGNFPRRSDRILFAGLEMALLDIQGKAAGRPVSDLLGGTVRSSVLTTAYVFRLAGTSARPAVREPSQIADLATELVEAHGFGTIKLKAGTASWTEDVAMAEAVRARFPDTPLRVDPNGLWPAPVALRAADRLRGLDLEWLEDPVTGQAGMAELTARGGIPTATNMCLTWLGELPTAVSPRCTDVVLLDTYFAGGLRAARTLGAACDAWQISSGLHSGGSGGAELGIATAAMLHLAAALPRLPYAADSMYHDLRDDVITRPFTYEGGALSVPGGPGLGVELDHDKLARYVLRS